MVAHYNPNTQEFDIDLDNRFIAERLTSFEILDKELGLERDPESKKVEEDLKQAQLYVQQVTTDLGEYISQTDSVIDTLSTKLGELKEYQDILEKILFDRLRSNKNLTANNMDQLYGNIVDEITNYIESEEGKEDYKGTEEAPYRDEVLNPGESTVATKRVQLETLKEFPNYRAYRNFVNQNGSDFFWELRNFLGQLDVVEEALNDVRFLKAEMKATGQEMAEIQELLDSVRKERKAMDPEQQLQYANQVLEAMKYEDAYNKILPEITKMEMDLLTPIIEGTDKLGKEQSTIPTNPKTGQGEQIDHLGDVEFNDQYDKNNKTYGEGYKRSWADNPYNGTAGNYKVNIECIGSNAIASSPV